MMTIQTDKKPISIDDIIIDNETIDHLLLLMK